MSIIIELEKYKIYIPENIISILDKYKQNNSQNESGGIILGSVSNDYNVYVSKLSLPTSFDKNNRYSFERDKKIAQILIDYEFYNSGGKTIYLGEWHTHPEDNPTPSYTDINMIKKQYKENRINDDFLIMLIGGFKEYYLGVFDGSKLICR